LSWQSPLALHDALPILRGATISGPVIGGGLYALGGGGLTYSVCLACFFVGCLLLQRVPVLYAEKMQVLESGAWTRFTAGIHFIRSEEHTSELQSRENLV